MTKKALCERSSAWGRFLLLSAILTLFGGGSVHGAGLDVEPEYTPAQSSSGSTGSFTAQWHPIPPNFSGVPSDVSADLVLGQRDFVTNADSAPSRSGIGYPMGSASYVRGDSHYLFVVDQGYHRVLIYESDERTDDLASGQNARYVIGQADFVSGSANRGSYLLPTDRSLYSPTDLFVDRHGNLFVSDQYNHRILIFLDPLGTDFVADLVIGQPNFTSRVPNAGGRSASSLLAPKSMVGDENGNLYVADGANHRVLVYFDVLGTDRVADRVIGQPGFATGAANYGGVSASSFNLPYRVRLDPAGNLYVADFSNSRGLVFRAPLTEDLVADLVIGQPNFATNEENSTGLHAGSMSYPCSLGLDAYANLYMADWGNNRILFYRRPLAEDAVADVVFGQASFTTADDTAPSASSLWGAQRIDFDAHGRVYISDCYNARVLRYEIAPPPCQSPVPWITTPVSGQSVSGNAVSVVAALGEGEDAAAVAFEYRRDGDEAWLPLGEALASAPYHREWNTDLLPTGIYWIRARAKKGDCEAVYSLPVRCSIDRADPVIVENNDTTPAGCTRTQGYWQNHHAERSSAGQRIPWPISEGTLLCGRTWLEILEAPTEGDAWVILAHQYIAARLNVASGASTTPEVDAALAGAARLLGDCAIAAGDRAEALEYGATLDAYNNGLLGPGHCDESAADGGTDVGEGPEEGAEEGNETELGSESRRTRRVRVEAGRRHEVTGSPSLSITIPSGIVSDTDHLVVTEHEANPAGGAPEGRSASGVCFHEIEFASGRSTFSDSIALQFSYPDADNDGLVDGLGIPENSLRVYFHNPASGRWELVEDAAPNASDNTLTARTRHFTLFGVFGQGTPPAGSNPGTGVAPGAGGASGGGGCLLQRAGSLGRALQLLRALRDALLSTAAGRFLSTLYYALA